MQIKGGEFLMGAADYDKDGMDAEKPEHSGVGLARFSWASRRSRNRNTSR